MFSECLNEKIIDVTGFDTSSVSEFNYTFWICSKLTELDLTNFDMRNLSCIGFEDGFLSNTFSLSKLTIGPNVIFILMV